MTISKNVLLNIGKKITNNPKHYPLDTSTIKIIQGNKLSNRSWKEKKSKGKGKTKQENEQANTKITTLQKPSNHSQC
jgi:hypothetical protein